MSDQIIEQLNARLSALETMLLVTDLSRIAKQDVDILDYAAKQRKTILAVGEAFQKEEPAEKDSEIMWAFERLAGIMEKMAASISAKAS